MMTRRYWMLAAGLTGASPLWAKRSKLKIGVTDWNLQLTGKVEAVALAKKIGFAGVEVSLGRRAAGDKLPLDNEESIAQYLAAFRAQGLGAAGTCLDILHVNYLKNDKLGQKWVADGIPITRKLKAKVMLLPFFGKGALREEAERMYVAGFLKEIAPEAKRAGIVLGLENTCSAEENARMMDHIKNPAVKVYYDVGNSTGGGYDIVKEIGWLGAGRICQFHLKDNPHFMGEGKIPFPAVLETIMGLGFEGFANLETSSPTKSVEDDMRKNLNFVQNLISRTKAT